MVWIIAFIFSAVFTFLTNVIYLHSIIFICLQFIVLFILGIVLVVLFAELMALVLYKKGEKVVKPKKIFDYLTLIICRFICSFVRIKVIVKGKEKIDLNKNYLFVSNHQSNLDPIIYIKAFPKLNLTFIMKQELMKIKLISRYLTASGFYSINRDNNREGLKTILTTIEACKYRSVAVFPEGTRSKEGNVIAFRDGIFKVPQKAGCDLIICSIDQSRFVKNRFPWGKTKVIIEVCDVIENATLVSQSTSEISENARNLIIRSIEKNREE